jgi:putative mRNA 3-end processing factor
MKIFYDRGIYVEGSRVKFVVDPTGPIRGSVDFVLVTHGHSDHMSRYVLRHRVVATRETFTAMSIRLGGVPTRRMTAAPGDVVEMDGAQIAVFEAGHILGSVMYLVEVDGLQILFTGDFNTAGTILTDAAEPVERPDVLVMEATYGDPTYVFPNRAELYTSFSTSWRGMRRTGASPSRRIRWARRRRWRSSSAPGRAHTPQWLGTTERSASPPAEAAT